MEDSLLAQEIRNKNQAIFCQLVEKYQQKIVHTCYGIIGNMDDARDIAQDVFVDIWQKIDSFRGDSSLSTWIYRIAINKSLNFKKHIHHQQLIDRIELWMGFKEEENVDEKHAMHTCFEVESSEIADVFRKALNTLPENQRTAFTLCKFEEFSYQEISEIMKLSLSSIESLIHRAKDNMQKKLKAYVKNQY